MFIMICFDWETDRMSAQYGAEASLLNFAPLKLGVENLAEAYSP